MTCSADVVSPFKSKALHAAAKWVWGSNAVIQWCQVHKRRNIKAHLAEKRHPELNRQLSAAYQGEDYEEARRSLETTARWLSRLNPDAAASLREGLEETLTVIRLGLTGPYAAHSVLDQPDRVGAVGDAAGDSLA